MTHTKVIYKILLIFTFCIDAARGFSTDGSIEIEEQEYQFPSNLVAAASVIVARPAVQGIKEGEKTAVRALLSGHEQEAVVFAVSNIGNTNLSSQAVSDNFRVCLFIMATYENEVLEYYEQQTDLSQREKRSLSAWGGEVSGPEALCFIVDTLIGDNATVPYKKSPYLMGWRLRYSDHALRLVQRRIEGVRDWSVHRHVGPLVEVKYRDEDLANFKTWWLANKHLLEWSEEKGKFFVDPAKEVGAGTGSIKEIFENRELSRRDKWTLKDWGGKVSDRESFIFIVDALLSEGDVVPLGRESVDGAMRHSDEALAMAQKRIEGTRDWSKHDTIRMKTEIKHRDADMVLFKQWWNENKEFLEWSEKQGKFCINPRREEGPGTLKVQRNRNRE